MADENLNESQLNVELCPKRKRYVSKRWLDQEVKKVLRYIQTHRDFEKPTAQIYYRKMLAEIKLDIKWNLMRFKMRHLRLTLQRADKWLSTANVNEDPKLVRETLLRLCPFYDMLSDIFHKSKENDASFDGSTDDDFCLTDDEVELHDPLVEEPEMLKKTRQSTNDDLLRRELRKKHAQPHALDAQGMYKIEKEELEIFDTIDDDGYSNENTTEVYQTDVKDVEKKRGRNKRKDSTAASTSNFDTSLIDDSMQEEPTAAKKTRGKNAHPTAVQQLLDLESNRGAERRAELKFEREKWNWLKEIEERKLKVDEEKLRIERDKLQLKREKQENDFQLKRLELEQKQKIIALLLNT